MKTSRTARDKPSSMVKRSLRQSQEQPIFFNFRILPDFTPFNSLLFKAGVFKLKHLLNPDYSFVAAENTHKKIPNHSLRLLVKELELIFSSLPPTWKHCIESAYRGETCKQANPKTPCLVTIDPFQSEKCHQLQNLPTKHLYLLTCRAQYRTQKSVDPGYKWKDILLSENLPRFTSFYTHPIPVEDADVQWRIIHGAVATQLFRYDAGFADSPVCSFCPGIGDLKHTFVECPSTSDLANFVLSLLTKIDRNYLFNIEDFIFLLPTTNIKNKILNLIFVIAKSATYKALSNLSFGTGPTKALDIFKYKLKHLIQTEYDFYILTDNMAQFQRIWCTTNALCECSDTGDLAFLL